ncbi:MAG TPA: DUF479 domain-containing protein [Pseudomonas xinjiangensis]|uniref:DUF479 domain-containing protein n=2 Tax=root TaxID=1 RepID=A0A7V1FQZ4_9GAMM|nr:DUF479 domain-containing protein [Halopseudomonas xinjiangensis]HEC49077.1 DUF479 domain-containing protein [Halopseudomonas xinjiangensis]
MNFLAHLYLGPRGAQQVLGSMLGDFVKGPVHAMALPEGVKEGIWLHRRIDSFTDAHPVVRRSKERVSSDRRRFAGIMVDMFYDHLLARQWRRFSDQPIQVFTHDMYALLLAQRDDIPDTAWPVIQRMAEYDWLTSYVELSNLHRALDNMSRRLKRVNTLPGAVAELEADYSGFEADFLEFMPEVAAFATSQAALLAEGIDLNSPHR